MATKWVYMFTEGNADMRNLLAVKAVKSLKLTSYAISNVANKTNVMQQWADATTDRKSTRLNSSHP